MRQDGDLRFIVTKRYLTVPLSTTPVAGARTVAVAIATACTTLLGYMRKFQTR